MTFQPTKKRQQDWIKRYFNGGVFLEDFQEFRAEATEATACYDALAWLSEQDDIHTLADAWDQCPKVEWLGWMFARMDPDKQDLRQWIRSAKVVVKKLAIAELWVDELWADNETPDYAKRHKRYFGKALNKVPHDQCTIAEAIEDCSEWIDELWDWIDDLWDLEQPPSLVDFVRAEIPNPWLLKKKRKS